MAPSKRSNPLSSDDQNPRKTLKTSGPGGPGEIVPRPDTDVDGDDNSPIYEDYPNEDEDVDELPEEERKRLPEDEDSDSLDYNNAVFQGPDASRGRNA